jgi:DNA-binding beta-propeller fold protein YncE
MKRDTWTPRPTPVAGTVGWRACVWAVAFGVLAGHPAHAGSTTADDPTLANSVVQYVGSGGALLSGPLGIAIDTAGREVVVANTGGRRIEFFDFRGRSHGAVAHAVPDENGRLVDGQPRSLVVTPDGDIYVSDVSVPYVDHLDFRGRSLGRIALPSPDDRLETGGAGALARAADGRLFVASRARAGRIYVVDANDRLVGAWGEKGARPGQLSAISGLAVLGDSELVVTCVSTELGVQVFDPAGHYRRGFGVHDIGMGKFSVPTGVTVSSDGRIWVVDSVRANLQVFDREGTYEGAVDGNNAAAPWLYPSALASDGRGMFAMSESGGNRLRLMWVE